MKLGTPVLASDIAANREMQLDEESYFAVGDTTTLCERMRELAAATPDERIIIGRRLVALCTRFDWDVIAKSTLSVIERAARPRSVKTMIDERPARPQ
jgi:glycosyltransferase involved in cell wall biosynthesis